MIEGNQQPSMQDEYRQLAADDVNSVPNTESHWLRLLARLNGNWVQ